MFQGLDPLAVAMLGLAVVGAVEFVKRVFDKDLRGAVTIFVAALVGAVFAPYAGTGLGWFEGMLIGLEASGLITAVSYMGGSKKITS